MKSNQRPGIKWRVTNDLCMLEISPAPARPLPCLNRLQEGLRRGLACSFVGNHEEVQHQRRGIIHLPVKATSTVLFNGSIGDWLRTTDIVPQGCLRSLTLFNIFLYTRQIFIKGTCMLKCVPAADRCLLQTAARWCWTEVWNFHVSSQWNPKDVMLIVCPISCSPCSIASH